MSGTGTYIPADLGLQVLTASADVLQWVSVCIVAGMGVMFTFIGIRKGIGWAVEMVRERQGGGWNDPIFGGTEDDKDTNGLADDFRDYDAEYDRDMRL